MDRRYKQARTYAGTRAQSGSSDRQEALTRARLARARVSARSAQGGGNESGPKSIDPFAAVGILRARASERIEGNRLFEEEGSGVYGSRPALEDARRQGDPLEGLLGGY